MEGQEFAPINPEHPISGQLKIFTFFRAKNLPLRLPFFKAVFFGFKNMIFN
jgi:hypothetical protein